MYGFCCGYCLETLETPYETDENQQASRYADERGWGYTFGRSRHYEGDVHVTCPLCGGTEGPGERTSYVSLVV